MTRPDLLPGPVLPYGSSEEPLVSVREMAEFYLPAIRNVRPHGPYVLVGFSFGDLLAYEMARLFAAAGEPVENVMLLDPPIHPGALPPRLQLQRRLRQIGVIRSGLRGHRGLPALLCHRRCIGCTSRVSRRTTPTAHAGPVLLVHAARRHERQAIRCPCGVAWYRCWK